jgi:phosphoribosyl 1,2-cyclic phosphodiesterase
MNRIYFPVQLNDLKAKINFLPVKSEMTFEIYGASIRTLYVHHPGFTVGYRLEYKNKTLVYISDNEPFNPNLLYKFTNFEPSVLEAFRKDNNEPNKRIYDFCSGADVLIHDATYTPEEYAEKQGWGHSDYLFALNIAERSNIKRLYLFHHDHTHNDNKVDYILRRCRLEARKRDLKLRIEAASEGMKITI